MAIILLEFLEELFISFDEDAAPSFFEELATIGQKNAVMAAHFEKCPLF